MIEFSEDETTMLAESWRQQYLQDQWYVQYGTLGSMVTDNDWLVIKEVVNAHGWIRHGMIRDAPSMMVRL